MSVLDGIMARAMEAEALVLVGKFIESQGGVQAVVAQFEKQGLGDTVKSWVATGTNQEITPENVLQVFGQDTIKQLAAKVGVSPDMVAGGLAKLLPQTIDKMTPEGKVAA